MIKISNCITRYNNLIIKQAKGSFIYTHDNRKILDITSGIGSNVLGHSPPKIVNLVKEQSNCLVHAQPSCYTPDTIYPLVQEMTKIMPSHLNSCLFALSGSEAVDHAIKIAKIYTKRRYIISLNKGFHGRTLIALSISDNDFHSKLGLRNIYHDCITINVGDSIPPEILDNTAAIIFEPIQGEKGGYTTILTDYIKYLKRVSKQYGIVLIADEIQSFLRTGEYLYHDSIGIESDITVLAKGLAGGYPLACVIGKSKIMDNIGIGIIGGTFQGNALFFSIATENLKIIRKENILKNVKEKGHQLHSFITTLNNKIPYIRGKGLMLAIEFHTQKDCDNFFNNCLKKDVLLMRTTYPKTLRLIPPLNINQHELNILMNCLYQVSNL